MKKIMLLISILMLTLSIGITASADDLYLNNFEDNNYSFYNLTGISYRVDDDIVLDYNIERSQVSNSLRIPTIQKSISYDTDVYNLQVSYLYEEYNEYVNLMSVYFLPKFYSSNKITLQYENFVLKDYFLEDDLYSSLEKTEIYLTSSSYFNIDSVDVVCYVLEYKFINDEWKIVPVLYEFNVDTFVNQEMQVEGINFALIYDELQNYNSKEEYAIRNMVIRFNVSYNETSDSNPFVMTNMGYAPYDYPITDIYTSINNQVMLVPIEHDYTSWLVKAVGGFLDTEIVPGFSIGGIFGVVLMIALLSYILKMFLGG